MNKEELFKQPTTYYKVCNYLMGNKLELEKMQEQGMGGAICSVNYDNYLKNEDSWNTLLEFIDKANEAGFITWLFDEKGYPSGSAGGLTVEGRPELEARGIYKLVAKGEGKVKTQIRLPEDAEGFIGAMLFPIEEGSIAFEKGKQAIIEDNKAVTDGMDGPWELWAITEKIMFEGTHAYLMSKSWHSTGHYPNLMDKNAVASFIEVTYEAYKSRIKDFDKKIFAVYTNEPSLMTHWCEDYEQRPNGECYAPWERTIPERFKKKFGYDLLPVLCYLLGGEGDAEKRVRYHYYTIVGELMTENFAGQLSDWCEKNGTKYSGHVLCEENMGQHVPLMGDFLKTVGRFTIPGADMAIKPHDKSRETDIAALKYVSSSARLYNKPIVQTLMDPILGGYYVDNIVQVIPLDVLISNLNLLFYCGINLITTYGSWDKFKPEVYTQYNTYAGRLSVMLQGALNKAQTALYYPIETFQGRYLPTAKNVHHEHYVFNDIEEPQIQLVNTLANNSIDFNFLNAEAILSAEIKEGVLFFNNCQYKVIIMPAIELIELSVIEKLNVFEKSGGTVIFTNTLPHIAGKAEETAKLLELTALKKIYFDYNEVLKQVKTAIVNNISLETTNKILFSQYEKDGKNLLFVVNRDGEIANALLSINNIQKGRVFDPDNGEITEVSMPAKLQINAYGSIILAY